MVVRTSRVSYSAMCLCILLGGATQMATMPVRCFAASNRTLWESRNGPFFSRVVLWDRAELTEPNLRAYYQRLSMELKGCKGWTVKVFVDEADATRELYGKLGTDKGYEWWWTLYNQFGIELLPMAELSEYEGNAILRFRSDSGVSSELVLSGENFLHIHQGQIDFDILQIYYHSLPPHAEGRVGDELMVSVYVRASQFPGVEEAREFSLLMRKKFAQKRVIVAFRTDTFFLTDTSFPIMYRFGSPTNPPTREQYENSKTLYCFCDRPGIRCR